MALMSDTHAKSTRHCIVWLYAYPGLLSACRAGIEKEVQIKIQRYEDVIDSLKKLLEAERRRTKQARAAHTLELAQRTQLQTILRQCVEDVRERRKGLGEGRVHGDNTHMCWQAHDT